MHRTIITGRELDSIDIPTTVDETITSGGKGDSVLKPHLGFQDF